MRKNLTVNLAILFILGLFIASCTSKKPKPESEPTQTAPTEENLDPSPEIAQKDINFDPQGSDSGRISGLNTVHFGYDKASLSNEAQKTLSDNADWIKKNAAVTVQIEGHTDSRGSIEYNISLGERRAKAVKNYLVNLGVDGKRLRIISYGEEKPVSMGDSEEAWGKNRRANFVPLAE